MIAGDVNTNQNEWIRKRINWKDKYEVVTIKLENIKKENNILIEKNNELNNILKDYNKYNYIIDFLKNNNIKDINVLKNKINEDLFTENNKLNYNLNKKQKEMNIIDNYISNNNLLDNYSKYKEIEKEKRKTEIRKKLDKNILKYKFINFCNYLYINKEKIKKEREIKIKNLENKMKINIIKSKTINILRNIKDDQNNIDRFLEKIKHNKNNINFDNKKINKEAIGSNRSIMSFLSTLYEEKEVNKTLNKKDFILAVNEFHSDKNTARMTFLCKIMYLLKNNEIIWNSTIIFKHIYSFQYIKKHQVDYLIKGIENIIKIDN